jgi:hypothetical protein
MYRNLEISKIPEKSKDTSDEKIGIRELLL